MNPQPVVATVTLNPAIDQTVQVDGFRVGEVNRVGEVRQNAGGKGVNVASALADLGAHVVATGLLGRENAGIFEELFRAKSIDDRFLRVDGATRVGLKIVDRSCHQVTEVNFPGMAPASRDLATLLATLKELARPGSWFALSGSLPPGVPVGIYADMVASIHERGGRVLLDTSGEPLRHALARRPDIVKPNQSELEQLTGTAMSGLEDVAKAASGLIAQGAGLVAVSMGARGALFARGEERLLATPPAVAVQSTVGAGDTMVAGLLLASVLGHDLSDTARLATACGAHAVTRIASGVDPVAIRILQEQVDLAALGA